MSNNKRGKIATYLPIHVNLDLDHKTSWKFLEPVDDDCEHGIKLYEACKYCDRDAFPAKLLHIEEYPDFASNGLYTVTLKFPEESDPIVCEFSGIDIAVNFMHGDWVDVNGEWEKMQVNSKGDGEKVEGVVVRVYFDNGVIDKYFVVNEGDLNMLCKWQVENMASEFCNRAIQNGISLKVHDKHRGADVIRYVAARKIEDVCQYPYGEITDLEALEKSKEFNIHSLPYVRG